MGVEVIVLLVVFCIWGLYKLFPGNKKDGEIIRILVDHFDYDLKTSCRIVNSSKRKIEDLREMNYPPEKIAAVLCAKTLSQDTFTH